MIPQQLQNPEYKFCLIRAKEKAPYETAWQKNGYNHDDPKLQEHLNAGGNYGVVCGNGGLVVVDFDNEEVQEKIKPRLPETFTVKSGGGLLHLYFKCEGRQDSFKAFNKDKETLFDVQGTGKQIVGPGSTHPNGKRYAVAVNRPIAALEYSELKAILSPYLETKEDFIKITSTPNSNAAEIKRKLKVPELLGEYGVKTIKNPTSCPLHSSKGGKCLSFKDDVWHCFHCDKGGDVITLFMEKEGATFKEAVEKLCLKLGIEQQKPADKRRVKILARHLNPLEIARDFIKEYPLYYDRNLIWWSWDEQERAWRPTDETDIINLLEKAFELEGITSSSVKTSHLNGLKMAARANQPENLPPDCLQFKNTIINFMTGETFPVSPKYFCLNPIPWRLGESEETPVIDKLFEEWVGPEYKPVLYEICAFALNLEYFPNRIWVFIGRGSNGKGTFGDLLERFLGKHNCTSSELDLLIENRFETMKLYKKLVCFMGETNFNVLKNTARLKGLTGRDLVNFEIKGGKNFSERNYAKLIISTNSLPTTTDKTDGFYRRFSLLDWQKQFTEKRDVLAEIPRAEFENLARKSVRILKLLIERGSFTGEGDIQERARRYEEKSDPLAHFIAEKCKLDVNGEIESWEFTQLFLDWLSQRGYRKLSETEIGRQLKEKGFEKGTFHYTKSDGTQGGRKVILGVKWLEKNGLNDLNGFSHSKPYIEDGIEKPVQPVQVVQGASKLPYSLQLPCSRCGAPPPCEYEDEKGKPLCEICGTPDFENVGG